MRFVSIGLAHNDPGYSKAFTRFATRIIALLGLVFAGGLCIFVWFSSGPDNPQRIPLMVAAFSAPFFAVLSFVGGAGNAYSRLFLGFLPTHVLRPLVFFVLIVVATVTGVTLNSQIAMTLQLGAVVAISVPTFLYLRFTLRKVKTSIDIDYTERKQWLGTSASLLLATLFTGFFPEVVIIFAGLFLPSDSLALLHVALKVAMLTNFALFSVDALTGPEIAQLHTRERHADMQILVNRATRLRFVAALCAVAVFAVFGRWILGLFGEEFVSGFEMLMILAAAQFVQGSLGPVARLMNVTGNQNDCLKVYALALLFTPVLIALLVPSMGATGAAIAAAIALSATAIWIRILVFRRLGIRPRIFAT
jgi:O-antigen/teichoic acid export membrane protein